MIRPAALSLPGIASTFIAQDAHRVVELQVEVMGTGLKMSYKMTTKQTTKQTCLLLLACIRIEGREGTVLYCIATSLAQPLFIQCRAPRVYVLLHSQLDQQW